MVLDAFYLSFLAWYVDKIWPSEFGTQLPWYFVFQPSWWMDSIMSWVGGRRKGGRVHRYSVLPGPGGDEHPPLVVTSQADLEMARSSPGVEDATVEGVSEALSAQVEGKRGADTGPL